MSDHYVKSPLNYVGGKYKLLSQIIPLFPDNINTFVDLFCGGVNVGANIKAKKIVCNDILPTLISLMNYFKVTPVSSILNEIQELIAQYGFSETSKFGYDYYGCNSSDGVAKINKEPYLNLRKKYNEGDKRDIVFYTLVAHSFSNNIRFNSKGEFNVAVNKRDFNDSIRSNLIKFVTRLSELDIHFTCKDYKELVINKLKTDDFVYCDPPYLITTANYNENGGWTEKDEHELLHTLDYLDLNKIKFALSNVTQHKGKENHILIEWSKKYNVHRLNFNYGNSNYHTKDKSKDSTQEVLITNY